MAITFGSRQSARKLRESGLEESQADAITEAVEELAEATDEAIEETKTQLVTKEYLDARLDAQDARLDAHEARMEARVESANNRTIVVMATVMGVIAAIALTIAQFT